MFVSAGLPRARCLGEMVRVWHALRLGTDAVRVLRPMKESALGGPTSAAYLRAAFGVIVLEELRRADTNPPGGEASDFSRLRVRCRGEQRSGGAQFATMQHGVVGRDVRPSLRSPYWVWSETVRACTCRVTAGVGRAHQGPGFRPARRGAGIPAARNRSSQLGLPEGGGPVVLLVLQSHGAESASDALRVAGQLRRFLAQRPGRQVLINLIRASGCPRMRRLCAVDARCVMIFKKRSRTRRPRCRRP